MRRSHRLSATTKTSCEDIRFENLVINGVRIADNMPGKPTWYKTGDMARIFVGEHTEGVTFE